MPAQTTGCFAVYSADSREVTPKGKKARGVLAYLIGSEGRKVSKTRLLTIFWPDSEEAQARACLRQVIHELRCSLAVLGDGVLTDREHLWINPSLFETIDPAEKGKHELYEDLDHITPAFDEWLRAQRNQKAREQVLALKKEAEALLDQRQPRKCLAILDQVQRLDPYDEEAVRLGLRAEHECGHAAGIIERYDGMASILRHDLGIEPSCATRALRDTLINAITAESSRPHGSGETESRYFARRSHEEYAAAERSRSAKAREAHQELARRYLELASEIE